jgi:6-pyruvoyltetrahydropterin/6-carboxytetrahydropterin synthase
LFGKCNNPNWHGHNYVLEVSVRGPVSDATGYVMDLAQLKDVVRREVIDKVDHRNLNLDVDFMQNVIPTTENLAIGIWRILVKALAPAELAVVRLWESENNRVEYSGG